MQLPEGKKIYFASDFHLGIPDRASSVAREKRICKWLDEIKKDAAQLYLVGDLFDAWMEYKNVVPKGYSRFFGKLAELRDTGLPIEVFSGNHDLWMRGYFEEELNITVHHKPIEREFNGKKFFIAHGDGLGPGDLRYKILKSILRNPVCQWIYRRIHPDTGVGMAKFFSYMGPKHKDLDGKPFKGPDKEFLVQFALEKLKTEHIDYFIFGHRHITLEYPLPGNSLYVNLGDWIQYNSYAKFDGKELRLKFYEEK
jgi:UDP-2,3-diacylglucosamine hydrolase